MRRQSIAGINGVEFNHVRVAGGLGDYRSRGDGGGECIAADDASLRHRAIGNAASINEHEVRRATKTLHRALHCQQAGMIDVYLVDLFDGGKAD